MVCTECAELHEGPCDLADRVAFKIDCVLDELDALLGFPPEPGSRRWLIAQGKYPLGVYPQRRGRS